MGRGEKSLFTDPGFGLRLGREKGDKTHMTCKTQKCGLNAAFFFFFFFFQPICHPSHFFYLLLPPQTSLWLGVTRQALLPPPHYYGARAFAFIVRRFQHVLPSSTRVEWCLYTHARKRTRRLVSRNEKSPYIPRFEALTPTLYSNLILLPYIQYCVRG